MKAGRIIGLVALLLVIVAMVWLRWKEGGPRRLAIQTLGQLDTALRTGNSPDLLNLVCTPVAVQGRTTAEQTEFIGKALRDELSAEGVAKLKRDGRFGPLTNLFPVEAQVWATHAAVRADDCLAFRLDRTNAPRVEVVLVRQTDTGGPSAASTNAFRILRCNNVR